MYVCLLNRESHWNEGLEDRPYRSAPPPAGHEDWPGALRAGLFPSSAVRRSLYWPHQQQVNISDQIKQFVKSVWCKTIFGSMCSSCSVRWFRVTGGPRGALLPSGGGGIDRSSTLSICIWTTTSERWGATVLVLSLSSGFVQINCLCLIFAWAFILTTLCLFSSSFLTLPDTSFVFFRLRLTLILARSQHVECLFSELQLLRFLDYYWLSQSFKPCLKSVAVDVVCVWICEDCSLDTDLCSFLLFLCNGLYHVISWDDFPVSHIQSESFLLAEVHPGGAKPGHNHPTAKTVQPVAFCHCSD